MVAGVVLCLGLLGSSGASARFVRPFVHQITGTPSGPFELVPSPVPPPPYVEREGPGGLAVDGEDNLWVGDLFKEITSEKNGERQFSLSPQVDEFSPSGSYVKDVLGPAGSGGESLAIDNATGVFYAVGEREQVESFEATGALLKSFGPTDHPKGQDIAVDNSTGSSAGSVYVVTEEGNEANGERVLLIERFNAAGEAESFTGSAPYIFGNKITGYKEADECKVFGSCELGAVAVDSANGDIYVTRVTHLGERVILKFSPAGLFLGAVSVGEALGIGGQPLSSDGLLGLAVDPADGDLLVGMDGRSLKGEEQGAVDEFDSSGSFLGQFTEAAGAPLGSARGLAVDSHGDLFILDRPTYFSQPGLHVVDELGAPMVVAGLRLGAASQRKAASAVLNGAVDPEASLDPEHEAGIVDCRFEYVSEEAFQKSGFEDLSSGGQTPCEHPGAGEIPKSDAYTPVHALVGEHVVSGVTYRYRLSATVGGALGGVEHSAPLAFTAPHAPRVGGTGASEVTSTFAQLSGDVDPLGADTSYHFQYLTEAQFLANGESFSGPDAPMVAPAAPVDVGPGGEAGDLSEAVFEEVGGLEPGTTYRFRLVASNEVGVSEGEAGGGGEVAHLFTTQAAVSPGLADGRAYELVTPTDKDGTQDMFGAIESTDEKINDLGSASESGDQFMLATPAAFGPFPSAATNIYVFSRHPVAGDPGRAEWGFTSLVSPSLGIQNLSLLLEAAGGAVDPVDLSTVAVNDYVGAQSSEAGQRHTVLLGPPGGPYATLHTDQPTHDLDVGLGAGHEQENTEVVGGSPDLGVVVLKSDNPALLEGGLCKGLTGIDEHNGCSPPVSNLYEWSDGQLSLLDARNGEPISQCGAALGGGDKLDVDVGTTDGAVSADGSRVFFTAPMPAREADGFNGLEGLPGCVPAHAPQLYMRAGEETVEVSAPEKDAPEFPPSREAHYARAAEDGSRVFFTSKGELTANDRGLHDSELYEYDTEARRLTRVSAGVSGDAAGGVLFAEGGSEKAIEGGSEKAITVSSDGSHVYFIATGVLAGANAQGRAPSEGQGNLYGYDAQTGRTVYIAPAYLNEINATSPEWESGEATPDGRFLLFRSHAELTPGAGPGQLYRYDAESEGVVCVSCIPGGPSGEGLPGEQGKLLGITRPQVFESRQDWPAHSISNDGAYVFFDTGAALVPQDTNGAVDVYEWHEGTISLVSSGQDSSNSYFLGASPDGANVFFGTHSRLVPADSDNLGDVYDARICTASEPCISPPLAQEGLCEGDACSHAAASPVDATPGSLTFSGAGDLAPAPSTAQRAKRSCVKPKRLSHGRCVRVKPKRRKTRAKRASRARRASGAAKRTRGGGR
jgi:hypothetical protein